MNGRDRKGKKELVSVLIVAIIVAMLVFSGPASAVTVNLEVTGGQVVDGVRFCKVGDVIQFKGDISIYTNDLVPFKNVTLYDNGVVRESWGVGSWVEPGFGYGYGYLQNIDNTSQTWGYDYGYGFYGYGYGYGYGSGTITLTFNYTVDSSTDEGTHNYTVKVYSTDGSVVAENSKIVVVDKTDPTISITSPTDGYSTYSSSITVSGTVDGTGSPPTVTVKGVDATLSLTDYTGTFSSASVSLALGSNTITATATDAAGNAATDTITVTRSAYRRGGGGGGGGAPPRDSDGDGYSDIDEMLAGTDPNDPCDPNPECAACLASKPAATPTPTPKPAAAATPTATPVPTPVATPTPTPTEEPGFEAVFAIAGLLAVAYLVLRRKSK